MAWTDAAAVEEIKPGRAHIVTLGGKEIGLFHESGAYRAVLNYCPHFGAPVCRGEVAGTVTADAPGELGYDPDRRILRCPWHHWEFDLATGEALAPIRQKIKLYPVRVEEGRVWVDL